MRSFCRVFIATVVFASLFGGRAFADQKFGVSGTVSLPAQTQNSNKQSNDDKSQPPDCTRPNTDWRCKPAQPPQYYPRPYRQRTIIINQLPAQPAIEINSLTDDWEGCRKAKLGSMHARETGDRDQANQLDEWLWKNCRTYSNELRQLEQDDM